jgi:hypothetical protein
LGGIWHQPGTHPIIKSTQELASAVHAHRDDTVRVWWTSGEEVPGLCCQEATFEALVGTVFELAPQLLVENGVPAPDAGEIAERLCNSANSPDRGG